MRMTKKHIPTCNHFMTSSCVAKNEGVATQHTCTFEGPSMGDGSCTTAK